jgi:replicative DNA helicase
VTDEITDQQLPHSEDLEAAIVSRLLADPAQLPVLVDLIRPEDFYVGSWRRAYVAMQELSARRKSVDVENLRARIGKDADELSRRLGRITVAHRASLEEYADQLRTFAFRRRVIGALETAQAKALTTTASRDEILASLQDAMQSLTHGMEQGNLLSPNQAADLYEATMAERARGERTGLTWGLRGLDLQMSPAHAGEMIVLAARPSVGKTVLAEQLADHWATQGPHPVLFVSLEMGVDSLLDRTVSRVSGLSGHDVVRGILTKDQQARALEVIAQRREVGVWYLDDPYATTSTVRAAAAKVKILAGGLSGIVIDYLQLLKDPGESEVQRVTRLSRQVKAVALEFKVPVLALSQLSRAVTQRDDQHPRLHDLRESGAIEQDADRVLGLWRENLSSPEADLDVLKSRQGRAGIRIYLEYDGDHFRFMDSGSRASEAIAEGEQGTEDALAQIVG